MRTCGKAASTALALGIAVVLATAAPALAKKVHSPHSVAGAGLPVSSPRASNTTAADLQPPAGDVAEPQALRQRASGTAARFAEWIVASADNAGLPFMIVDKLSAEGLLFDADGDLLGRAPVLVGSAPGDDSAPGIGDMALSAIPLDERTTPAGRFVSKFGPSRGEGTVLWVDYDNAISMHPVITSNPKEHRLQRIRSAVPAEHRISHGCINVPAKFYADLLRKAFEDGGVVYVLPDTKPLSDVFPEFAASAYADASGSLSDRCEKALSDVRDGPTDSDPTLTCPVDDQRPVDSPTP